MTVEDDGIGLPKKAVDDDNSTSASFAHESTTSPIPRSELPIARSVAKNGTGIGLANLRARLETLYGRDQTLELASRPEHGVIVRIELPWNSASAIETNGVSDLS